MALYTVIGNRVGGLIGVIALLVVEGDVKSNTTFLLKIVFFLASAAPKRVVYPNIY